MTLNEISRYSFSNAISDRSQPKANEWKQGNTDVVSALLTKLSDEGRLPLSEELMGITDTKTSSQLSILQNQFADIQSQLESIMYSVTKMVDWTSGSCS